MVSAGIIFSAGCMAKTVMDMDKVAAVVKTADLRPALIIRKLRAVIAVRNWQHVAQLFDYGSAVRKILYTTNAVESVNSSLRKVTKKEPFQMKMHCLNCCIYG